MHRISVFLVIGLFIAVAGSAQPCDVVIMGAPGTHYSSIGSAVASVTPGVVGKRLIVSGVCKEKVTIQNHVGLTLEGTPGASLELPDGPIDRHPQTLNIRESDSIAVRNLPVRGRTNFTGAVSIWNSRQVELRDLTIENGGGAEGGVWVVGSFGVMLINTTIQNNSTGIRVDGPASATLQGGWVPGDTGTALLQNNQTGTQIRTGAIFGLRGDAIVRNNNVGIVTNGGAFRVCCTEDAAHPRVELNRFQGLSLRGGDLMLAGPFTVQDNGGFGIVMFGTEARIADTIVRRNGGGMIALSGRLEVTRGEITSNNGAGVVLTEGARGRILGTTITGNNGEGIDAQMLSVMGISSFAVIRDNKGFDVRCSPNSHGHGFADNIGKMNCPGFNRGPDPTPGGED